MPCITETQYASYDGRMTPADQRATVSNSLAHKDHDYYMRQMGVSTPSTTRRKIPYRSLTAFPSDRTYNFLDADELGVNGMSANLPDLRARPLSVSTASYGQQVRANSRAGDVNGSYNDQLEADWTAGRPSELYYRRAYTTPLSRSGRSGGHWRHIGQVTGQAGNNLLWVEGSIKDEDVRKYPPFGIVQPKVVLNRYGQRMLPRRQSTNKLSTFNERAKKGFEYWYNEPKSNILQPPPKPFRTISGHQHRTSGVGYNF